MQPFCVFTTSPVASTVRYAIDCEGTFGRVRIKYTGGISSVNALPKYLARVGTVRYDLNTSTRQFGNSGTTSIPVPQSSVMVRRGYSGSIYPTEVVRYDLITGARYLGMLGTTSIAVPDTSVRFGTQGTGRLGNFGTPTKNTPGAGIPYPTFSPLHKFCRALCVK